MGRTQMSVPCENAWERDAIMSDGLYIRHNKQSYVAGWEACLKAMTTVWVVMGDDDRVCLDCGGGDVVDSIYSEEEEAKERESQNPYDFWVDEWPVRDKALAKGAKETFKKTEDGRTTSRQHCKVAILPKDMEEDSCTACGEDVVDEDGRDIVSLDDIANPETAGFSPTSQMGLDGKLIVFGKPTGRSKMRAEDAREATSAALEPNAPTVKAMLDKILGNIKEAADNGFYELKNPLRFVPPGPAQSVVWDKLEELGYVITYHDCSKVSWEFSKE